MDVAGKHLCNAAGHYPSQDITYNQSTNAPIWFLEGYHSSHANGFGNVWWDPCLGEQLAHVNEQGGGGIVIEN